jgi:hypothetical protein
MHTTDTALNSNTAKAAALATRLEAINATVKASDVSQTLIDTTLKMGMAYAVFLTEVEEGISPLNEQQIEDMLERTDKHCEMYENEFSNLVKGSSEQ